jgi:uncharacterized protein involved in exopolysaccharide biosynthesis
MDSPNLISLLRLIRRWWKHLAIVCGIALIGSVVISDPHIMPPKYKSTSTFFASSPNMTSSQTLFVENTADYFGTSDDIDRLLSIAQSAPLMTYIVHKYKLFEHYKIDSSKERYPNYTVSKELEENYNAVKNDKGAIEVTVYDEDKNLAAQMCNDIVAKIDDINNDMILDNKRKILNVYLNKIHAKNDELHALSDSIVKLKESSNRVNRLGDLRNAVNLDAAASRSLAADEEKLAMLEDRKKSGLKELNTTIALSEQYQSTINKDISTIFVLEKAYPAEKKSKPIRWLIVLGSLIGVFTLSVIVVALIERMRAMEWEAVMKDE